MAVMNELYQLEQAQQAQQAQQPDMVCHLLFRFMYI